MGSESWEPHDEALAVPEIYPRQAGECVKRVNDNRRGALDIHTAWRRAQRSVVTKLWAENAEKNPYSEATCSICSP
jgi:hypothetical protein